MNSNIAVGPSFRGTFTFKTVDKLVGGRPVYHGKTETIQINGAQDPIINRGLAYLLAGDIERTVTVAADRLNSTLGYISKLIKKPLAGLFKAGETVGSGDLFNPQGMHFELKTANPKPGDVHLFWESEKPFDTLRFDISDEDIVALVKEARYGLKEE